MSQAQRLGETKMIETILLSAALACPIEFERVYFNRAWGYVHQRCLVDSDRQVWFERQDESPIKVREVSEQEFEHATTLAQQARDAVFTKQMVAADMGDLSWIARIGDDDVTLKIRGNYSGGIASLAATDLVRLMDKWCEGEPNFPYHINKRP